ncbi:MAG: response regulator [Bacteroidota bacterium]|nr:response regulator [Bacteroidota bacterium]
MQKPKPINFFVVDDESSFIRIEKKIINKVKDDFNNENVIFNINTFTNFESAKEGINNSVDIALLDYHIVDKNNNGITSETILEGLKTINEDIHVIMLTGENNPEIVKRLKNKGASFFISKSPKTIIRIIPTIKSIVRKIIKAST